MRSYSAANVMEEYLETPAGFFGRMFRSFSKNGTVELEIMLPRRFFLKGELITETIQEKANLNFSVCDLVDLLTEELLDNYSLEPNPLKMNETLKEISSTSIIQRYYRYSKEELISVKVKLSKRDVFKLEMMLADIAEIYDEVNYSVENILEMQYVMFINDTIRGAKSDAIRKIIRMLNK
ncbi:hypothetical protein J2W44_006114 [Priestia aryabhattai]|uniref:hypothetical protein n=1 Tax=Priestia aryabhattai TaxID=412384 RepID=UPI0027E512FF|nr:hypothetical protein [Priestia aryabhattai]MDP9726958.1 hypothetical protein [Priestia aryabhattai]